VKKKGKIKNCKAKGSRLELMVKKIKEREGYKVTKSGGSLGAWDICCLPTNRTENFPCKPPKKQPSS